MINNIQKKLKNRKGFTLVELIIVIAILGILAAIVVPQFKGFTAKAKIGADKTNIKILQNAAETYEAEHGSYPDSADDITEYVKEIPKTSADGSFYFDTSSHKIVTTDPGSTKGFEIK